MVYVFLATGFEETEALVPVDVLRRGGVQVRTVGVTGKTVYGAHGIGVTCDITVSEAVTSDLSAVVLPGGMPGTANLEADKTVSHFVDYAADKGLIVAAICAAPSVLGHKGILRGKKAVCFPGFEKELYGAEVLDSPCVRDGNIITAKSAGAAFDFAFELLKALDCEKTAHDVGAGMYCQGF